MIKFLIVLCILYIAYQVVLPIYGKYEEAHKLDKEYEELVRAEDCSVCLWSCSPGNVRCRTCRGIGYDKLSFRAMECKSFKNIKKEVNENG